jgi:hypothetical protein
MIAALSADEKSTGRELGSVHLWCGFAKFSLTVLR